MAAKLQEARSQSKTRAHIVTTIALPAEALTVVAAPPDMLSQRNVEAVTGIPARIFLELIRASDFRLLVVKLGKLRLVERTAFLAWLRDRAEQDPPSTPANDTSSAAGELDAETAAMIAELELEPVKARPAKGRGLR